MATVLLVIAMTLFHVGVAQVDFAASSEAMSSRQHIGFGADAVRPTHYFREIENVTKSVAETVQEAFDLEEVKTTFAQIPLSKIIMNINDLSFRDAPELTEEVIKPLADNIHRLGLLTPISVYDCGDGDYLVTDGHNRILALQYNVKTGRAKWDTLVPAVVSPPGTSLKALKYRAGCANLKRRSLSPDGELRLAVWCHQNAIPKSYIADELGISATTVRRMLKLASHPWMVAYVEQHDIPATLAVSLLLAAEKAGSVATFRAWFDAFAEQKRPEIAAEVERRKAAGLDPLPDAKLTLRSYITPELVQAWKTGMAAGTATSETEVFEPIIGKHRIEIPAYTAELDDASAAELAKFHATCLKIIGQVEPIMVRRAAFEKMTIPMPAPKTGDERLKELGLGELVAVVDGATDEEVAEEEVDEVASDEVASDEVLTEDATDEVATVEVAPAVVPAESSTEAVATEVTFEEAPIGAAPAAATALGVETVTAGDATADQPAAASLTETPTATVCDTKTEVVTLQVKPDTSVPQTAGTEAAVAETVEVNGAATTI